MGMTADPLPLPPFYFGRRRAPDKGLATLASYKRRSPNWCRRRSMKVREPPVDILQRKCHADW